MENKKKEKNIEQLLNNQTKVILNAVNKRTDTKIDELAVLMHDAFQSNQDYMDKKFDQIDKKFTEVKGAINNINLNIVDVVRLEDFNKLEERMIDVEEVLHLKVKNN